MPSSGEELPHQHGMNRALRQNISSLTGRELEEARQMPLSQPMAQRITAFTGSMLFVFLHLVVFGLWLLVNIVKVPGVPQFDLSFVTLAMFASVEAIFLSTFVLISQNRMAEVADRGRGLHRVQPRRSALRGGTPRTHLGRADPRRGRAEP